LKHILSFLLLGLCLAWSPALVGCGQPKDEAGANPAPEPIVDNRYANAGPTRLHFTDVTAKAELTATNHSGRAGVKEFLLEAVGPGAAWFDYDGDGLLDVYIPDGDVFSNYNLVTEEGDGGRRVRKVLRPKEPREEVYLDQLWRNDGDGTFTNVAAQAGIHEERWSFGATPFDYDGDGDMDIFVANFGPNTFWRNNGDGTFTDIAEHVGLAGAPWTWSTAAAVGDVDGDGRLDIYVAAYSDPAAEVERMRVKQGLKPGGPVRSVSGRDCRWKGLPAYCGPIGLKAQQDKLYRQEEDGTFLDVSEAWGVRPRVGKYAFTSLMFDFNDDGLLDIYVANDSEENFMWQQERTKDGHIRFRDTSDTLGIKVGNQVSAQASMGAAVADIDADGKLDIFVTNFSHDYNNIYISKRVGENGPVYFKDRGMQTMGQQVYYDLSWGCGWYDFDNDGDVDLYVSNGHVYKEIDLFEKTGAKFDQLNALFECIEPARLGFREVGTKAQLHAVEGANLADLDAGDGMAVKHCSRQAAFADFNNDGRMDILVMNMNLPPSLLLNTAREGPEAHWIKFSLRQEGGNREALGATLRAAWGPDDARKVQRMAVIRQRSFLGCDDPRLHLGLGEAASCDVVVTWPGIEREQTTFRGLAADKQWLLDRSTGRATEVPLRRFDLR